MKKKENFVIKQFPSSRIFTNDIGKLGLRKHHIKALIEIDVTDSRKKIKLKRNESGNRISFTSWILKCIGKAIDEHKQVHALQYKRNKVMIFNEIDLTLVVEKKVDNDLVPIPLLLRNINNMNQTDIYYQIENAKKEVINSEKKYVLEKDRKKEPIKLFLILPQFLRLIIWKILLSNPKYVKKMMGTVIVTSLGMIGKVNGWIIPYSIHPLCFALGSIIKKTGVIKDKIEIREFIEITILIDHDVVDGAPAARFVSKLKDYIENGYDL
jgi:pyruvate/2-oxoglutarate dehydrogenase complex dihydrolipoamide acyltransferase (E2) component